jgi:hypothetical protein
VSALTLATGALPQAQVSDTAVVLDALAATVGPRIIRVSELRLARDLGLVSHADDTPTLLERLVDRALMLVEIDRFQQPPPPNTQVDALLEQVHARLGPERWQTALARSGVDEAHVRAVIADDLRLEAYLRQRFGPLAEVTADTGAAPADAPTVGAEERRRRRFDELVAAWIAELRARGEIWIHELPAGSL